jgi:hypothetical protein
VQKSDYDSRSFVSEVSARAPAAILERMRARLPSPISAIPAVIIRGRAVPYWAVLLVGYAISRVVTSALLAAAYWLATSQGWSIAHFDGNPGFMGYLQSWDGLDYRQVALHGYPTQLPHDASGAVLKNPWAFLPAYPLVVRAFMFVSGLDFEVAGVIVAATFGLAATFALHRLLLPRFGGTTALWGALFFCFGPLSFVLQVTYAESMFLFFMFASLALMMSRRYALMIPFAVVAAFAHPGAIALAAAIGLQRLVAFYRREPSTHKERLAAWISVAVIGVAGLAWPVIASAVTHNASGYFQTELAWWRDYIGAVHFVPFTPWFLFSGHYLGMLGIILVLAVLAAFTFWLTRMSTRTLGHDILGYTVSYSAYLFAVFLPQQSLIRMLLPLSPLLGHQALSRTPKSRRITLTTCILLQPVGIMLFWVIWPP